MESFNGKVNDECLNRELFSRAADDANGLSSASMKPIFGRRCPVRDRRPIFFCAGALSISGARTPANSALAFWACASILKSIMCLHQSRIRGNSRVAGLLAALLAAHAAGLALADDAPAIEAVSRPSKDVTLSFTRPGRVAEVLVIDGQAVTAGQMLVHLDDQVEQAALAQLKAQSDNTINVEAAKAQLAQSEVDLKKIEWAAERGAATPLEVEHARLQVLIDSLRVRVAKFEKEQAARAYEEARLQVDRMKLVSSIDGIVEKVTVEVGESVDAMQDVIRIVAIDPLWIDVPTPLAQASGLRVGQPASVALAEGENGEGSSPVIGKIIHIASVADAASDTLMVRVEAPNNIARPAGQRMWVRFGPTADATEAETPNEPTSPTPAGPAPVATPPESINRETRRE